MLRQKPLSAHLEGLNQKICCDLWGKCRSRILLLASKPHREHRSLSEEEELKLLTKAAKQRKDSAEIYEKQNRADLLEVELAELAVIQEFLPKALSETELIQAIQTIIDTCGASGPKDMGKVMGLASKELAGKADGKAISEMVKKCLAQ